MESTLHRQLKELYAGEFGQTEVVVDGYRIDVLVDERLIEIQHGSLGALRSKLNSLLQSHSVLVVKPLPARKFIIRRKTPKGKVVSSRYSPRKDNIYNLFDDMVYFVDVFPHPRLELEILLTEQEEHRLPKKKKRWRRKDYDIQELRLREVQNRIALKTIDDLLDLLPDGLPLEFTTADLAKCADIPRWLAQKMAYCLRKFSAIDVIGKHKNALLYCIGELPNEKAKKRVA